jgi:hypothetical protein
VRVKGFEDAVTKPVEAAVGAGDPQGNAKTCQFDATVVSGFIGCIQFSTTEDDKTLFDARVVGFLQTGGAAHVILLTQPATLVVPFEMIQLLHFWQTYLEQPCLLHLPLLQLADV